MCGDHLMVLMLAETQLLMSTLLEDSVPSSSTEGAVQWGQLESTHVKYLMQEICSGLEYIIVLLKVSSILVYKVAS